VLVTTVPNAGVSYVAAVDPASETTSMMDAPAAAGPLDAPCVAAGSTHFFVAKRAGPTWAFTLIDRDRQPVGPFQLSSGPWELGPNVAAMAAHERVGASPTLLVVRQEVDAAIIVAGQQDGAAREVVTLPGAQVSSVVLASPTLYIASRTPGAEVVYSVDVNTQATGVFVSKASGSGAHAAGRTRLAYDDAPYGLALDDWDAPRELYFAAPPSGAGVGAPLRIWRVALP
jgi:hypothetical protein